MTLHRESHNSNTTFLHQKFFPSQGWNLDHVSRFEYRSQPVYHGRDAIVLDALTIWEGWHAYGRYYGFLDRWLSVFVTFDIRDLSLTSYPENTFPFAFNCDMTTPHFLDADAIYTTDVLLDVLVLADGRTHKLKDVEEFEQAYTDGMFGTVWYQGAKREAERVIQEAENGQFIDMLQDVAPFPDRALATE